MEDRILKIEEGKGKDESTLQGEVRRLRELADKDHDNLRTLKEALRVSNQTVAALRAELPDALKNTGEPSQEVPPGGGTFPSSPRPVKTADPFPTSAADASTSLRDERTVSIREPGHGPSPSPREDLELSRSLGGSSSGSSVGSPTFRGTPAEYDRLLPLILTMSTGALDVLTQLHTELKGVLLNLSYLSPDNHSARPPPSSAETFVSLTNCISYAVECLDRLDWISAQIQEIESRRHGKGRVLLRKTSSRIKGMFVTIQGTRVAAGMLWSETFYLLEVETPSNHWEMEKTFLDFKALYSKLMARYPSLQDINFPAAEGSGTTEADLVEFLGSLWKYPEIADSREMLQWLCQ